MRSSATTRGPSGPGVNRVLWHARSVGSETSFWEWPGLPELAKLLEVEWGAFEDVARAVEPWREYRSEANDLWTMLGRGATAAELTAYLTERREQAQEILTKSATRAQLTPCWRGMRISAPDRRRYSLPCSGALRLGTAQGMPLRVLVVVRSASAALGSGVPRNGCMPDGSRDTRRNACTPQLHAEGRSRRGTSRRKCCLSSEAERASPMKRA